MGRPQTVLIFAAGSAAPVVFASLELRLLLGGDGVPLAEQAARLGQQVGAPAVEADQVFLLVDQVDPAVGAVAAGREGEGQQRRVGRRPLVELLQRTAQKRRDAANILSVGKLSVLPCLNSMLVPGRLDILQAHLNMGRFASVSHLSQRAHAARGSPTDGGSVPND